MINIEQYLNDGACYQARIVLNIIAMNRTRILDNTFDINLCQYMGDIFVGRFENCREQGYVFTLRYKMKQKNYLVYEHRNTDSLCVIMNDTHTINTPTFEQMWKGREKSSDYDKSFEYEKWNDCAEFIITDMIKLIDKINEEERNKKFGN